MGVIDYRPADGGGSCASCRGRLGLASLKREGRWYCSSDCSEGRVRRAPRSVALPETWLYARPRRFFGRRRPKELNASRAVE